MGNLIIIRIENTLYGIWEAEALKTAHTPKFHMFPMAPAHFCGMADMDGTMSSLYDLGACLGHARMDISAGGHAIIVSTDGRPRGFGVTSIIGITDFDQYNVIPLPRASSSRVFKGCAVYEGYPVVIVDINLLHDLATSEHWALPSVSLDEPSPRSIDPSSIRLFVAGSDTYAIDVRDTSEPEEISTTPMPAPLAPQFVEGLILSGSGSVRAVVNIPSALGEPTDVGGGLYLPTSDGELLLSIEKDIGIIEGFRMHDLPPIAACSAFCGAVVAESGAYALLDAEALSRRIERSDTGNLYSTPSGIMEVFTKEAIKAQEFDLIGDVFAVPGSQVEDVMNIRPYSTIPGSRTIMVGIAEIEGEVLPVLDLALCFGLDSTPDGTWKMIKMAVGGFRALLLTPMAYEEKMVSTERQFLLPIHQTYRYVYGCYTDSDKVRLLLNVKTLAVHFDMAHVSHVFDSMHKRPKPVIEIPEMPVAAAAASMEMSDESEASSATQDLWHEDIAENAAVEEPSLQAASIESSEPEAEAEPSPAVHEDSDTASPDEALNNYLAEEPDMNAIVEDSGGPMESAVPFAGPAPDMQESYESSSSDEALDNYLVEEPDIHAAPAPTEEELEVSRKEEAARQAAIAREQEAERQAAIAREQEAERQAAIAREQEAERQAAIAREQEAASKADEPSVLFVEDGEPVVRYVEDTRPVQEEPVVRDEPVMAAAESTPRVEEKSSRRPYTFNSERKKERKSGMLLLMLLLLLLALLPFGYFTYMVENTAKQDTKVTTSKPAPKPEPAPQAKQEPAPEPSKPEPAAEPEPAPEPVKEAIEPLKQEEVRITKKEDGGLLIEVQRDIEPYSYKVKRGDTLWHISGKYTGNPFNYPIIANENSIRNPDLIFPGQKVEIKPMEKLPQKKP